MSDRAVVLLSGGQDSTTCLFWARARWPALHAVSLDYGQAHASELQAAAAVAARAGCASHVVLGVQAFAQLADSSLTGGAQRDGWEGRYVDEGAALPSSYVPGRNLLMLTLAAARAAQVGAHDVVTGVCQTDYSGYPDCRGEFVDAAQRAAELALPASCRPLRVHAPLLSLTKAETVRLAAAIPGCMEALSLTVTCYRGLRPGCGSCPACALRARGFAEAGVTDPSTA
jgi:7-cyano-7-deazaguanine synthase